MPVIRALVVLMWLMGPAAFAQGRSDAMQGYPDRPIRMVTVSAAGGSTDILARQTAQKLGELLGQQVVVDNRAGGGGIIASEIAARAQPDGYTLLFTHTAHTVIPSLHAKLSYDALKDFSPVSLVAYSQNVLLVHPSVPAKTVKELIELAKAQPGKLNYSAGTTGASVHLASELFKLMAGVNIVHVPYKGGAAQVTALIAGEVQMTFTTIPAALPHIKAGRLRALAVGNPKRSAALPDVPTVAEAALPGFDVSGWNGILAPARTPKAIVTRINRDIATISANPDLKEKSLIHGVELTSNSPEEFGAYLRAQMAQWAKVVKASGMRPD